MIGKDIDSIIDALYDSICGPAGQRRDWQMVRTLFIPGARILRADVPKGEGTPLVQLGTHEFVASIEGPLYEKGFFGKELGRRKELSGTLAKVISV